MKGGSQFSAKDRIDRHSPTGNCRLGVGDAAPGKHDAMARIVDRIARHVLRFWIDIPYNLRARLKVVRSFRGHLPFSGRAIIALTANFGGKRWWALDKAHRIEGKRAHVECRIG